MCPRFRGVLREWFPCGPNTSGTDESVHISEVSLFQGETCVPVSGVSLESGSTVWTYISTIGSYCCWCLSNTEEGRNGVSFSLRGCSPSGNAGRQTEHISIILQGTLSIRHVVIRCIVAMYTPEKCNFKAVHK